MKRRKCMKMKERKNFTTDKETNKQRKKPKRHKKLNNKMKK